jgi:uncharacterized repeat protein (TIGR02543 family)
LDNAATAYDFQSPVNANITLTAKWQEESTVEYWQVTWVLNGGAWTDDDNHASQVVKGGTLAEPAEPVKAGSTFDGWYREAALTNKITFPYSTSGITADFTLYARWETDTPPVSNNHNISSAAEWNAAVAAVTAAGNNKSHTFTITQSFSLPGTSVTVFDRNISGLTVTIKGQGNPAPEISLAGSSQGHLIYHNPHNPQTIHLENVTLKGHANNNKPLIDIDIKGELVMEEGSLITGNTNTEGYGGGVRVGNKLMMNGGEISGNIAGTSGKANGKGGGVYMSDLAELIMEGGSIGGNLAYGQGGGVYTGFSAKFYMKGGTVFRNTARETGARGGGVYSSYGKFYMSGGLITGYNMSHGNVIDVVEHYTINISDRDSCNAVIITATAMGSYGAAFYSGGGDHVYGIFEGDEFTETGVFGSSTHIERDITVVDGVRIQP